MYYPIQIPYLPGQALSQHLRYTEEVLPDLAGFVTCFWQMEPLSRRRVSTECIIVTDGCIDLVANMAQGLIGFAGMSKTEFHHQVELPTWYLGARLMPGAFYQLTGLSATRAMDQFLPVEAVFPEFDREAFFSLPFSQARQALREFLRGKLEGLAPDAFTTLFPRLFDQAPATAGELYRQLNLSPRRCQRLFAKHYGFSPKLALSILRFQKCLQLLASKTAGPAQVLEATAYYDQPHFNNDFKRNMGVTPLELLRAYQG